MRAGLPATGRPARPARRISINPPRRWRAQVTGPHRAQINGGNFSPVDCFVQCIQYQPVTPCPETGNRGANGKLRSLELFIPIPAPTAKAKPPRYLLTKWASKEGRKRDSTAKRANKLAQERQHKEQSQQAANGERFVHRLRRVYSGSNEFYSRKVSLYSPRLFVQTRPFSWLRAESQNKK